MSNNRALNYYDLKKFCEMTTFGKLTPMQQVELPNISGDQIFKIPYKLHLDHLCNKYDENVLSLCSTLINQINQDMISRLELSPIFREKVSGVIKENNFEDDVQCSQVFPIHENRFDYGSFIQEKQNCGELLSQIEDLNSLSEEDELYDNLTTLIQSCDECDQRIHGNMDDLKRTTQAYQPKYGSILLDLGTRHKPFYMEGFIKDPNNTRIVQRVNREVSQRIPDNIETIMMNVGLWLPQCISRESRRVQNDYRSMLEQLKQKKSELVDMKNRLPDPNSDFLPQTNFLQNLVQSIISINDSTDEETDPDPDPDPKPTRNLKVIELEDKIKNAIDKTKKEKESGEQESGEQESGEVNDDTEGISGQVYELSLDKGDKMRHHFYSSGEDDDDDEDDDDENDDDDLN